MAARSFTTHYELLQASELSPKHVTLARAARAATELAYAPYSEFRVGAAARLADGEVVSAANLENAAYPQCLCAEATLLGTLHTQHAGVRIESIAVAVAGERPRVDVAAPCGSCRQQLHEAQARQGAPFELLLCNSDGSVYLFSDASALLPFGFAL